MRSRIVLALVALALAGCLGGAPAEDPAPDNSSPTVIEDPDDYTYVDNASFATGGHIHDYWDGEDRLVVMDRTDEVAATWLTSDLQYRFRPPSDRIVPQGAARVDVTLSWSTSPTSHHGPTELWLRTAADDRFRRIQEIASGETVTVPSNRSANDLPHNMLSAWAFEFRVQNPNDPVGPEPLIFDGEVSIHVEAHRGLPLPVFPSHPDRWGNASTRDLISSIQEVLYVEDGPCWVGCPIQAHSPRDGSIVPFDAATVTAVLETTAPADNPTRVGLAYHGADTREFTRLEPDEQDSSRKVYEIPVTPETADSPYAKQSRWRFRPTVDEPREDGAVWNNYTITAEVHRDVGD